MIFYDIPAIFMYWELKKAWHADIQKTEGKMKKTPFR